MYLFDHFLNRVRVLVVNCLLQLFFVRIDQFVMNTHGEILLLLLPLLLVDLVHLLFAPVRVVETSVAERP